MPKLGFYANQDSFPLGELLVRSEGLSANLRPFYCALFILSPFQAPVSHRPGSLECRCAAETHISLKRALPPSSLPVFCHTQPWCNHMAPILTLIMHLEANSFPGQQGRATSVFLFSNQLWGAESEPVLCWVIKSCLIGLMMMCLITDEWVGSLVWQMNIHLRLLWHHHEWRQTNVCRSYCGRYKLPV